MALAGASRTISLPDGRVLAVDDVGDPRGVPVAYLHGTPDSRLARHPDDGLAAAAGVRLLAIDRPGFGDSDLAPGADLVSLGADLAVALDELGVGEPIGLLGWSSGGLAALGVAAALGARIGAVTLVATLPPVEAYEDGALVSALGPTRRPLVELAAELSPAELAAEVTPHLVPLPLTPELALEHVLEGAGPVGRAELASVPGTAEQLARGLELGVSRGLDGVEQDLQLQLTPGLPLHVITIPVRTVHGDQDGVSPPAVGAWLADRVPTTSVETVAGGGHHLLFPHWERLLGDLTMSLRGGSGR